MRTRALLALLPAVGLVAALAGCSGDAPEPAASSDAASVDVCATPSGDASEAISVTGDFGAAPEVEFDAGLEGDETERTVVIEGDGDTLEAGGQARVAFTLFNAATGDEIDQYGYADGETQAVFAADTTQFIAGIAKTLGCVNEGSRVASYIPAAEGFGEAGSEDFGVGAGEGLVAVIDVLDIVPTVDSVPQAADGEDQPATEGFPTVTLADDGEPTVDVDGVATPTELQVAVLKKGDGEVVPDDAQVIVQYKGVLLADGTEFDSSWSRGEPAQFALSGVVPGFAQAIAGQTIGSQVIAVIPADLAYGDQESGSIPANSPLVFVIDILAAY
ncbi:FKBP-type peptidyl-prolyl cis-trans isomerase [Herbiconiux sp. L3-i23]|uniref:FKBP-type peptidyl-prolyl cis-trans isomerase n=1 Tax=Herbiconiux sp. L3-i23 TaxID=2905871 RepID=UPI0020551FDE|nr:FKBP-type peptidyl-prolyl cis-trans isomerase [Herbiconiux sp. L3-i23]BDI22366.1 peptidylprolyl isomerase [Herbiconiux sp. L3-i23]